MAHKPFESFTLDGKFWCVTHLTSLLLGGFTVESIEAWELRAEAAENGAVSEEHFENQAHQFLDQLHERIKAIVNTYGGSPLVEWRDGRPYVPERTPNAS